MALTLGLRKLIRTAHITITVGWIGAVACFLLLSIVGLTSRDAKVVQAAYLSMQLIAKFVIVPLSFAPLVTGPLLSLGTPWGLFRHYWILAKLVITILCTIIMQIHMQPINQLAVTAAKVGMLDHDLRKLQVQMVVASSAALVALLTALVLAVYKPRGMTAYGWRKQYEEGISPPGIDATT